MNDWTIVMWSAARQIAEEAELPPALWPDEEVAPQDFFVSLRENSDPTPALSYAATALPKLEAIEWALHTIPEPPQEDPAYQARRLIRDSAIRWVGDPDDDNRRALYDLAESGSSDWPETIIALAIFFSGGSIAPEDGGAVTAPDKLCSNLVSGAVQLAVARNIKSMPDLASKALALADDLATRGREALATT